MNSAVALQGSCGDVLSELGAVEQAMSLDFVLLSPDTHVGEALVLMEGACASTGLVVEVGRLIGFVTRAGLLDVRTFAWRTGTLWGPGRRQDGWRAADVMTRCRRAVSEEDPLARAAAMLYEDDLDRVPVKNVEGQPVGVLSRRDVLRAVARH